MDDHWLPRFMSFTAYAVPSVLQYYFSAAQVLIHEDISGAHVSVQQLYVGTDVNEATSVS